MIFCICHGIPYTFQYDSWGHFWLKSGVCIVQWHDMDTGSGAPVLLYRSVHMQERYNADLYQ